MVYIPRRLYRVLEDIAPTFFDMESDNPIRGTIGKAVEHIIQQYMESKDYMNKVNFVKNMRWKLFVYLSEKEQELRESKEKSNPKS